jgi:hypothetical protein
MSGILFKEGGSGEGIDPATLATLETITGAQDKSDAAEAAAITAAATDATTKANAAQAAAAIDATNKTAGKANLSGGNILSGSQQNSGIVTSSAALGTDPTQLPTQAQVKSILAPAYVEPLVDLNLAGWDRATALLNSGSANSCNVTLTGTPLEVETTRGAGLDFGGGNKFGEFNAALTRRFDRIVNGRPFTLILEGDNLISNTLVAANFLLSNFAGWPNPPFIQIMSDTTIGGLGGLVRLLIISSDSTTTVHLGISNYNALNANNITKIYASGSTNSPVVFYLEQQNGQRFVANWLNSGTSSTIGSNTNTMANNLQLCRERSSSSNSSAAKISRIRLYDRVLDI